MSEHVELPVSSIATPASVAEFLAELAADEHPWGWTALTMIRARDCSVVRLIQYRDGAQGAVLWEDGEIAATWTSYDGVVLRCASAPDDPDAA